MPWEKQFDIDQTLEKAGETFWSHGYEATSMRDLLEAMGIQKGSFYATYGSKREAYMRALEQYSDARIQEFSELAKGPSALEAIKKLFDALYEDCVSPQGHRGCMVINCALELAHRDPKAQDLVQKSIASHEGLLRHLIEAGQETREIDSSIDARATAKAMMSFTMGMRVYSRSGGTRESVRTLADQAVGLVI